MLMFEMGAILFTVVMEGLLKSSEGLLKSKRVGNQCSKLNTEDLSGA